MNEQRDPIFPPSRRDAEVTREVLRRGGHTCAVCHDAAEVAHEIDAGSGALIMTDAALALPSIQIVLTSLSRQPAWSDLPVVLLCQTGPQTLAVAGILGAFTNVAVLDRPTSARTLISTVRRQHPDQLGQVYRSRRRGGDHDY